MSDNCCAPEAAPASHGWKKILKIALVLNFIMFIVETLASRSSSSMSLQADAMDFLGDAFNYGISLYVAGQTLKRRARVSLLKGLTMSGFGVFILIETIIRIRAQGLPVSPIMGIVGTLALVVNVSVALLLYKYREGESNMQSVWLCTRNDAIGNITVIIAAGLVQLTQTGWPDWIVGLMLAVLGFQSGIRVIKLAKRELSGLS